MAAVMMSQPPLHCRLEALNQADMVTPSVGIETPLMSTKSFPSNSSAPPSCPSVQVAPITIPSAFLRASFAIIPSPSSRFQ